MLFLFQISFVSLVFGQCLEHQRSLLLELNNSLVYSPAFSTKLIHWDQNVDCCQWSGVECDTSGRVIGLDLDNKNITDIENSTGLFSFQYLEKLNLAYNCFASQILTGLVNLTNLATLNQSNCNVSGSILSTIGNLSELVHLDFSVNSFSGPIPAFTMSNKLTYIDLSTNILNGSLSPTHFVGLSNLSYLNLSFNALTGRLSPSLFELPSLQNHVLSNNRISGNFSDFETLNSSLEILDLSSNQLEGHITESVFKLERLNVLDLHSNKLQGNLPAVSPASLIYFSVASNRLTGEIPITLCNGVHLQVIDLSNNSLSDGIPQCLVQNLELVVLYLGENNIDGNIPDTFPVHCGLKTLDLRRNSLDGKIPASLANCKLLEVFNVGSNNINDTFPYILKRLSSLRVLVLRSNRFTGDIKCSGVGPHLQIIDIASNSFTGILYPGFISSWTGMVLEKNHWFAPYMLNLSWNSFRGEIPRSVGNLTGMESLDLSSNQLTGEIPRELTNLYFLSFFNVSYNNLSGSIPSGHQFDTFSAESYEGNTELCGFPLKRTCNSIGPNPTETAVTSSSLVSFDWLSIENWPLFLFTGAGFGMGASVIAPHAIWSKAWNSIVNF